MWNFLVITTIFGFCVLVHAETETQQSKYGPLKAPNCGTISSRFRRIVGGTDAGLGTFPWMAMIGMKMGNLNTPKWLHSGSIISARHILTSAQFRSDKSPYVARVGDLDLNDNVADGTSSMDVGVEEIFLHPEYERLNLTNNIAILRLERDLQFTEFIKPICLPVPQDLLETDYEGTKAFIAGWGYTHEDSSVSPSRLQTAQIELVKTSFCKEVYSNRCYVLPDNVICAGHSPGGKDTCYADGGTPLMIKQDGSYYSIGITSDGIGCGRPGKPSVYTRVSSYLEWIVSKLN